MAIDYFTGNHVQKFEAFVLKGWEDIRLRRQRYEIRLDHDPAAVIVDMAEQAVLMASTSPAAFDVEPFARFDETRAPSFLEPPKQRCQRNAEGP